MGTCHRPVQSRNEDNRSLSANRLIVGRGYRGTLTEISSHRWIRRCSMEIYGVWLPTIGWTKHDIYLRVRVSSERQEESVNGTPVDVTYNLSALLRRETRL